MILKSFRERLESYMPNEYMRPFACKDNPYDCRIFIVGENPSTKMEKPFIVNYWSDCTGFLYDTFYHDYDAQKSNRQKRQGTRPALKKFVDGANPIPCLETNIYSTPAKSGEALSKSEKNPELFEFLLREIQRDLIFLFRAKAIDYFEKRFNCVVDSDRFVTVDVFGHATHVLCSRRGRRFEAISHNEVCASGKQCRDILINPN